MAEPECSDPLQEEHRWHAALIAAAFAVVLVSALYTHAPPSSHNCLGLLGYCLALCTTLTLGVGAWLLPVVLGLYVHDTLTQRHPTPIFAAFRRLGPIVGLCTIANLIAPDALAYGQPAGGIVGEVLGECLRSLIGVLGVVVLGAVLWLWRSKPRMPAKTAEIAQLYADTPEQPPDEEPALLPLAHDDQGDALIAALRAFNVSAHIENVRKGPRVTQYGLALASGTRGSRVASLVPDIARTVKRKMRFVDSVDGIGFEVENEERATVYLRNLLRDPAWKAQKGNLSIALGVTTTGEPVYVDLASMPHLLVAGGTDSGKSVGLHAMLASMLTRSAKELRLIVIDPKKVEFAAYRDIPHLAMPVITDMSQASRALGWVVDEMERRYARLTAGGAQNIDGYNANSRERMPRLVVIVDEFADIAEDVETSIKRLAAKARAAGIHLILATQRPSADVITGTIKTNLRARIAYTVSSSMDSRIILDRPGAESLLGQGDLLMKHPRTSDLVRVHGAYVSGSEIRAMCDQLRAQGEPEYEPELDDEEPPTTAASSSVRPVDDGYERACSVVRRVGYASASLLQREMSIGYPKAAKFVERMEKAGFVGRADEANGGKRALLAG